MVMLPKKLYKKYKTLLKKVSYNKKAGNNI